MTNVQCKEQQMYEQSWLRR